MKKILLFGSLFLISIQLFSQDFEVPKDYKFEKKEDYSKYEKEIIAGIDWISNTPITKDQAKRKEVYAFIMKWLTGSPNVSIEITQDIVTFIDCADCLMIFMAGWAKYSIETRDYSNKIKGNLAGIESVIEFYKKNSDALGKNKAIKKYIQLKEKNELAKYVESKI